MKSAQSSPPAQTEPEQSREQKPTPSAPAQPSSPGLHTQKRPAPASQSVSSRQPEPVVPAETTTVPDAVVVPAAPPAASVTGYTPGVP